MVVTRVDLYEYWNQSRQGNRGGYLTCWTLHTPSKIGPNRRRPGVLILPGGAYRHVSEREAEPVAMRFAARGYGVFLLEYSCAPATFPVALREAAMAMAYIRGRAADFQIHPGMVAALGFSAGGHLCGTLGMLYDCPEVQTLHLPVPVRPDALVLCYPVAVSWGRTHGESFENISGGDPALKARLSLDRLVRPDMPPVFLWHTRDDETVPCRNSLVLAQALEEAGVEFSMHLYRHGRHGLSTADGLAYSTRELPSVSPDVPQWPEKAMDFLGEIGFSLTDEEKYE